VRSISLVPNAATILLLSLWIPNSFAAKPSGKSVTSARTIPSASKTTQRRFVSTSKTNTCVAELTSVADSFLSDRRDSWI